MESPEQSSEELNEQTAEEQEEHGGRFARESGQETSAVDSDEDLEDRGDV